MRVICINEDAFYALLDEVLKKYNQDKSNARLKWITTDAAMVRLGISSKTSLQKLRDRGAIEFSQPMKKIILYDIDSIDRYLEKNRKKGF